ncbi:hypothetical protein BC936DRAFT_145917 [Jimgerdemannia flammicorona]|uniref:Uncharacterized protein n=1 Tax=Jimgerdemannia flammicorona TaxID=994334 RepID=A0A433D8X4_9FUNG|nr:hypothetical protein BC936DRAFT_145917 [Jimgerdemannia flammicorona]
MFDNESVVIMYLSISLKFCLNNRRTAVCLSILFKQRKGCHIPLSLWMPPHRTITPYSLFSVKRKSVSFVMMVRPHFDASTVMASSSFPPIPIADNGEKQDSDFLHIRLQRVGDYLREVYGKRGLDNMVEICEYAAMSSSEIWLPRWTPHSLVGKRFYHLRSDVRPVKTWLSEDKQIRQYFPSSINITIVNGIEQAEFVVVDNEIKPTDHEYLTILQKARDRHIPILKTSDVEVCSNSLPAGPSKTSSSFWRIACFMPMLKRPVKYHDSEGRFRLTFKQHTFKNDEDTLEDMHHQVLLRDPIVRGFATWLDPNCRDRFCKMTATSPLRIAHTRWKVTDVLNDYVNEAYTLQDRTFVRQWDEEKFNDEFESFSGGFKPTEAIRASLFMFFKAHEKTIRELLPPPSQTASLTEDVSNETSMADPPNASVELDSLQVLIILAMLPLRCEKEELHATLLYLFVSLKGAAHQYIYAWNAWNGWQW